MPPRDVRHAPPCHAIRDRRPGRVSERSGAQGKCHACSQAARHHADSCHACVAVPSAHDGTAHAALDATDDATVLARAPVGGPDALFRADAARTALARGAAIAGQVGIYRPLAGDARTALTRGAAIAEPLAGFRMGRQCVAGLFSVAVARCPPLAATRAHLAAAATSRSRLGCRRGAAFASPEAATASARELECKGRVFGFEGLRRRGCGRPGIVALSILRLLIATAVAVSGVYRNLFHRVFCWHP